MLLLGAWFDTASAQGTLTNGAIYTATVLANSTNSYTFAAAAGDNLLLRDGLLAQSGFFNPWLRLYGPDGALIGSTDPGTGTAAEIALRATNSGTFTVTVCDGSYTGFGGAGTYQLNYAKVPGGFVVLPSDEGGAMTNGATYTGTNSIGDLDVWSFDAANGDSVILRIGSLAVSGFYNPWLRLYGTDGTLLASADAGTATATEIAFSITNSGTFTVVVSDGSYTGIGGSGSYRLSYVKAPGNYVVSTGDEGGALVNGATYIGTNSIGDLDVWSFNASSGDNIVLRIGLVSAAGFFNPWLRLYGPDGALLDSADAGTGTATEIALRATNSGTFTVVVSDGSYTTYGGTGAYQLDFVKAPGGYVVSPGDDGGVLTNGSQNTGAITLGDLDVWSFEAATGDSLVLRAGLVTAAGFFNPWLRLYGPDGALVGTADAGTATATEIALRATNSGTFTVIVSDGAYTGYGGTGTYQLNYLKVPDTFVVSPGDDGGPLTNGTLNVGTISLGDFDVWSFDASTGDNVVLRAGTVTAAGFFNPALRLYGPDGALVGSADSGTGNDAEIPLRATNSGTFTVVVADGAYTGYGGTGSYALSLAHAPGAVFVSSGDEGGSMTNGVTYTGTNALGDLDVWSFYGTVGDSNLFRVVTTNFTPWLRLYGPGGVQVKEAFVASTGNRSNALSYIVTNAGPHVLVLAAAYLGQSGTYGLKQSRVPPDLNVPDTQIINEGATLNVFISAQDPDLPDKALTFTEIFAPPGVVLTPIGNTNATITWPTDETTGPSTNTIIVSVTDNVGGKDFIRTNSFIVIVNELNEPPVLSVPGQQVINELTPLNVSASATDPDIPANPLTYSLVAPPSGMTIDPDTGAIAWTPTEAQGPFTNTITVVVTDTNPPAVNTTSISVTNSFTVIVREVNVAPQLTVPVNQTITELTPLNVSASATDSDLPANTLTYALISPPSGMTINTNTGAINWTPTEAQGSNTYTTTVVVTDNSPLAINTQQLSDTKFFTVTVNESNSPPRFTSVPTNQIVTELTGLNVSVSATDDDLPANTLTYALVSPPSGMTINTNTGAINWTPTEAQGSNFYTITVTITDANRDAINQKQFTVTTNFTVTVNESNSPPVLTVPGPQTLDELTPLNVSASATDVDVPANPLIYALITPPSGMNINPNTGAINWTPTEAQGSNFYTITVTVTDTNRDAINQKQFTVTNSFAVTVNESNSPPVLQTIAGQSLHYGVPLSVQAVATDADLPTNTLTFTLDLFPSNMTINAGSGVISWTPVLAQFGTNAATVRVTDNGTPAKFDTKTFTLIVTGNPPVLAISLAGGNLKQVSITGDVGLNYDLLFSTNLVNWDQLLHFNLSSSPYPYIDPASASAPKRFYRLRLAP